MSKQRVTVLVSAVVVAMTSFAAAGQTGRVPRSAFPGVASLDQVARIEMAPVDVERLRAEDSERERGPEPVRPRFAEAADVALAPWSHGTWETLADGSRLWRLRITSPGALSLNLGLDRFDLPPGARFWIHDPEGAHVQGPYTSAQQNADGGLWTAVVLGDELVAELLLPTGADEAELEISSVNRGYRYFGDPTEDALKRGACNVNVVCPEGDDWRDQIRSVARISIRGLYLCSGQLMNNTAGDETPYFLTAQHCILNSFEATTVVAYWNYETPTCSQFTGGSLSENQSGATWVASSRFVSGSDFTLIELDAIPDPSFDVHYTGWDARGLIPESTTTIHHPAGDQKSIAFDDDAPTITAYVSDTPSENGRYWRIDAWDLGITEAGSSGGCLFDGATGRCVGTLSGGFADCDSYTLDGYQYGPEEPDWFARVFNQYTGEGTPTTRLSDWLDPADTGALFVDGQDGSQVNDADVWLIPAAASLPGFLDSNWKSQVSVVNTGSVARNVTVYLVRDGAEWPGEMLSGPFAIRPEESLYLDDLLEDESPVSGMLYASATGDGTVAFSRTYNLDTQGATFGQGVPAVRLSDAELTTELVLPMVHSVPGRYRTNLGFAQASGGRFRALVQLYAPTGELLGENEWSIFTGWRQIDDIFSTLGVGDRSIEGGWIRVTLTKGEPAFWTTYATVIDNQTNDPTYVMPVAP